MGRYFPGGSGTYIDCGNAADVNPGAAITGMVWASFDELGTEYALLAKYDGGAGGQYLLRKHADDTMGLFCVDSNASVGREAFTVEKVKPRKLHHLLFTFGGGGTLVEIYLDGVKGTPSGAMPLNLPASGTVLRIGNRTDSTAFGMKGSLYHAALWQAVLSKREIATLVAGEIPYNVHRNALTFYAPLNEATRSFGNVFTVTGNPIHVPDPLVIKQYNRRRAPRVAAVNLDAASVYVDIQVDSAEVYTPGGLVDLATVPVTIAPSGVDLIGSQYTEAATVYVDIQASAVEVTARTDLATVLVDIRVSASVDVRISVDSATVLVDLTLGGGECFSTVAIETDGEASTRWYSSSELTRWDNDANTRWSAIVAGQEVIC